MRRRSSERLTLGGLTLSARASSALSHLRSDYAEVEVKTILQGSRFAVVVPMYNLHQQARPCVRGMAETIDAALISAAAADGWQYRAGARQ
jgi:hypothetical protein